MLIDKIYSLLFSLPCQKTKNFKVYLRNLSPSLSSFAGFNSSPSHLRNMVVILVLVSDTHTLDNLCSFFFSPEKNK